MDNKKIINIMNISLAVILSIAVIFNKEPEYLKEEIIDNSIQEETEEIVEERPNRYYSIDTDIDINSIIFGSGASTCELEGIQFRPYW